VRRQRQKVGENELKRLKRRPNQGLRMLGPERPNDCDDQRPALGEHFGAGVKDVHDGLQLPATYVWVGDGGELNQGAQQQRLQLWIGIERRGVVVLERGLYQIAESLPAPFSHLAVGMRTRL